MPSDLINTSDSTRIEGEIVLPFFAPFGANAFDLYNRYWYMEHGFESIGMTEDEMTFRIPAENVTNYSFDQVLNPRGILSAIKFDTPVVGVRYYGDNKGRESYEIVWGGFVKQIRQKSEGDQQYIQVTCTSVKKVLRDICVRGHYCWDGVKTAYRDTPLFLNKGGRPSWTFNEDKIPMPAVNPDWGYTSDEQPLDPEEQSSEAATYCTLGMLLKYLITCFSPESSGSTDFEDARDLARLTVTGLDTLPNTFPFRIIWPSSFGQTIDQDIIANFNNAVGQNNTSKGGARKGRDIRFRNGQPLVGNPGEIGVLDTIFAECGSFSYALRYGDLEGNEDGTIEVTLECVPTRVIDASQAMRLFYAAGSQNTIKRFPVAREIDYVEKCSGTFTRMIGVGSTIKVERRMDSFEPTGTGGILRGWDAADFAGWRRDSVVSGVTNETLMYKALKKYPHLFSRYLFDPTFLFMEGTDFGDYPRAHAPRAVWPYLLSYQGADVTTEANDIVPYPVRIEFDPGIDGDYVDAHIEQDGFISWDNGYFEFPALRDVGINRNDMPSANGGNGRIGPFTWGEGGWGSVTGEMLDVGLNDIRVTVAIPDDNTLNWSIKNPSDQTQRGDEETYVNAPDSPDAARFDTRFSRTMVLDLSRLYDLWLRINSYPVPESAGGVLFVDRPGIEDAIRSDMPLLKQNVNKSLYERNRLQREGYFRMVGHLLPPQIYPLGQQISEIAPFDQNEFVRPFPLNCCIQRRVWNTKNLGTGDKPKWTSSTDLVPI